MHSTQALNRLGAANMPRQQTGHHCAECTVIRGCNLRPCATGSTKAVSRRLCGSLQPRVHLARQQVTSPACHLPASNRPWNQPRHQQQQQAIALHSYPAVTGPNGTSARPQAATCFRTLPSSQSQHCTQPHLRSPSSVMLWCSKDIWKMKASLGACMQNKQGAGQLEPQRACKLPAARLTEA